MGTNGPFEFPKEGSIGKCLNKYFCKQHEFHACTPAKSITYMCLVGFHFLTNYISVTQAYILLESLSPKITVCDSENYMEQLFGNYSLGNLSSAT